MLSNRSHSIAWIHGSIDDLNHRHYSRAIQRRALKHVDKIIAISKKTYDSIINTFPEFKSKVQIIYNGFNFSKIRELCLLPNSIIVQQPAICFVGRLDANKNPLVLLDVVKLLFEKGHLVNVYFLGEGIQRAEIITRAESYRVQEHVFILGYQNNPYPIMSQCRAICMMSKSEGFPTVFAESMALGIPFVTTPVGGVIELSNHGQCGYIINSIEECADAIEELVFNTEKWKRMSSACINHVQEFDLTKQIGKIESLIDETIK